MRYKLMQIQDYGFDLVETLRHAYESVGDELGKIYKIPTVMAAELNIVPPPNN